MSDPNISFDAMVARAKAEQAMKGPPRPPASGMWDDTVPAPPVVAKQLRGQDSIEALQNHLKDPNFAQFVRDSYESPHGYALRLNPVTGKTEMMVAGTHSPFTAKGREEWAQNVFDGILYSADYIAKHELNAFLDETWNEGGILPRAHIKGIKFFEKADVWRQQKQKDLAQVAKEKGVDVIYGHSRGGALVSDMKVPGVQKVGLDAAMLIAHEKGTLNLNEGKGWNPLGKFDEFIGTTGQNNVFFDASPWTPHKVWLT